MKTDNEKMKLRRCSCGRIKIFGAWIDPRQGKGGKTIVENSDSIIFVDETCDRCNAMKEISDKGIKFIQSWETLRLKKYMDGNDGWTIGWGHLIKPNERIPDEITENEAGDILLMDLRDAENAVNTLVTVPLTPCQFDALVSFVFNIGRGHFKDSTLLALLNKGHYAAAAQQFIRWRYDDGKESNGLKKRRHQEKKMFTQGVYEYTH